MHGRIKVKTTEEQAERKRKERGKKLELYQNTASNIFDKRKRGELDEEVLTQTGLLLSMNPDFATLWNIRRELFENWMKVRELSEVNKAFDDELYFLEQCLRTNPKSYGSWHQRQWVLSKMALPDWKRELNLCAKFLEYDERNFHCWDYRRFVVAQSRDISATDELAFTTAKISSNFSNFSSWHYRSKLLPVVHPAPNDQPTTGLACNEENKISVSAVEGTATRGWRHSTGVAEEILLEELDLVQNAFFTDPSDQSAWFYHRWLLGRNEIPTVIDFVHIDRSDGKILVALTKPIQVGKEYSLCVQINQDEINNAVWSSPIGQHNILWTTHIEELKHGGDRHPTSVAIMLCRRVLEMPLDRNCKGSSEQNVITDQALFFVPESITGQGDTCMNKVNVDVVTCQLTDIESLQFSKHNLYGQNRLLTSRFSQYLSSTTSTILTQQLDSCKQLHELEPDNKWVLLTIVSLMRALQPASSLSDETFECLDKLTAVDPMRSRYYQDLRSRFVIEREIENLSDDTRSFAVNGENLTMTFHLRYLVHVTSVDLSHNALRGLSSGYMLQCVRVLVLADNKLSSSEGIQHLPCLEKLNLARNDIGVVSSLKSLSSCPRLHELTLEGNPICHIHDYQHSVTHLLPSLACVL